ncbi:MAG TPA: hypothetical protein PLF76_05905, partial [Methanomassiliicoccaceae archaeon]|nr:hypothetical protein [Methanomassiliicoccaceae archaeon]
MGLEQLPIFARHPMLMTGIAFASEAILVDVWDLLQGFESSELFCSKRLIKDRLHHLVDDL